MRRKRERVEQQETELSREEDGETVPPDASYKQLTCRKVPERVVKQRKVGDDHGGQLRSMTKSQQKSQQKKEKHRALQSQNLASTLVERLQAVVAEGDEQKAAQLKDLKDLNEIEYLDLKHQPHLYTPCFYQLAVMKQYLEHIEKKEDVPPVSPDTFQKAVEKDYAEYGKMFCGAWRSTMQMVLAPLTPW
ncbi:hypothetical protein K435DRAFT_865440 [Dendrothele bispora CBS 962.96]|uniref:Uncharacterized protein n=1 Tax=Dendrothele bispora (strain CBS 962.96) TaxID=1314807 RepID=A0A4S8LJN1_DENBC|nr:hypothetical protein K435DRAFT_865440 [Dendrothele bispora CBS 962.96]